MFTKSINVKMLTTVLAAAAVIPMAIAIAPTEASAASVSEYVIAKDGVLYAIDVEVYKDMKLGGAPLVLETTVKHIRSSNDKVYLLEDYLEAKLVAGNMNDTLELLDRVGESVNADIGEVVVDSDGNITYEAPAADADFRVMSII